jgi:hypothetical protein
MPVIKPIPARNLPPKRVIDKTFVRTFNRTAPDRKVKPRSIDRTTISKDTEKKRFLDTRMPVQDPKVRTQATGRKADEGNNRYIDMRTPGKRYAPQQDRDKASPRQAQPSVEPAVRGFTTDRHTKEPNRKDDPNRYRGSSGPQSSLSENRYTTRPADKKTVITTPVPGRKYNTRNQQGTVSKQKPASPSKVVKSPSGKGKPGNRAEQKTVDTDKPVNEITEPSPGGNLPGQNRSMGFGGRNNNYMKSPGGRSLQ